MVKREKKTKLRGSVLLTVVCVMSLLIVLLFGTLTLATAANNRAHVNYSTAQTGVTSRTVVDAAIKAMEANSDFGNAVAGLKYGDNKKLEVNVDLKNVPDVGRLGHVSPVTIEAVGQKKFYNYEKQEWVDGDIVKFTSTVSMAGVDTETSGYIVKQPPGKGKGNGGGGAGFVTTAGAALTCQTNLYGGTYINVPKLGENKDGVEGYQVGSGDNADIPGAVFYNYSYTEPDGITARNYANWESDKTIYRQFKPYNASDTKNTAFHLDKSGAYAETDVYVNNNVAVDNWSGFIFPDKGKGITIWGDLRFNDGKQNYISNIKSTTDTTNPTKLNFNEIPYIYVDGKITHGTTDMYFGDFANPFPLNIFCGSIQQSQTNNSLIAGDIYCMNPNETSTLGGKNKTTLYSWTASVVNKTKSESAVTHEKSSIYSAGNLNLKSIEVDGDVRVAGDCAFRNIEGEPGISVDVIIHGDLVVGGTLTIESSVNLKIEGDLYCNTGAIDNKGKVEKVSSYTAVPTYYHTPEYDPSIHVEIINKQRRYLTVPAKLRAGQTQQYEGLFDEWIWTQTENPITQVHYKWKENFNPDDCEGHTFFDYTDINEWNANGIDIKTWIDGYYITKQNGETNIVANFDGATDYYTVETYYDSTFDKQWSNSKPTNRERFLIYRDGGAEVAGYYTLPNADGSDSGVKISTLASEKGYSENADAVWYNKSGQLVSKAEGDASLGGLSGLPIADYTASHGKIYPEYAERDVILGLKTIDGVSKEDTQIVKTMEEVLNTIANPYEEGKLSNELVSKYDSLKNDLDNSETKKNIYFDNFSNIPEVFKKYANVEETGLYTVVDSKPSGKLQQNQGAIINSDCVLNMGGLRGAENGGYLIFEPGNRDMLVIVNKLELENMKIIVNDSEGGTVNFFIESGNGSSGIMKLSSSTNWVAPTTYLKAFANNTSNIMSYGGGGGLELEKLGKPNINIYGATGTELISTESGGFIANIVSSDLKFTAKAGEKMLTAKKINQILYNNNEVIGSNKPFVIGCINSSFADVDNSLNVLFVTDDKVDSGSGGSGENEFDYRVLYYDEY